MTRTRQSAAHGRRGAFRRETTEKKSVIKPKHTPPHKPAAKGRYTCLKCLKFSGPRRAVEDHCRGKHKLTGKKLETAVGIVAEKKVTEVKKLPQNETTESEVGKVAEVSKEVQDDAKEVNKIPERGSKRSRTTSDISDSGDTASKRRRDELVESCSVVSQEAGDQDANPENTKEETDIPLKESDITSSKIDEIPAETQDAAEELVESGSSIPGKKPSKSNDRNDDQQHSSLLPDEKTPEKMKTGAKVDQETPKSPVSISPKTSETPPGTCLKCKRTFSKPRQLIKHKCFAAIDDDPVRTPKQKPGSPGRASLSSKGVKAAKTPVSSAKSENVKKKKKDKKVSDKKVSDKKVSDKKVSDKKKEETKEEKADGKVDDDSKTIEEKDAPVPAIDNSALLKDSFQPSGANVAETGVVDAQSTQDNVEKSATEHVPEISTGSEIVLEEVEQGENNFPSGEAAETTVPKGEVTGETDGESKEEGMVVSVDVKPEPEPPKKKSARPSRANKYDKLVKKMEQLSQEEKEKIDVSIVLRKYTAGMDLVGASEKIQLSVHNGGTFCVCSFCSKIHLTPEQMKEHLCQHVKDYYPFQCKSCDFLSRKRGRITAHMKKAHGGYLQCQFCSYNTYDEEKLNRHYKYWNRDFSNSCQFCHKKIAEGTKEEHMVTVHGKKPEELANINLTADAFTCRYCGERQKSRHARRDHEKRHDPHYTCPLCPYMTNGEAAFVNHGRKHRVILVCSECLTKFHSSQALKDHLKVHVAADPTSVQPNNDSLIQLLYERSINQSIFVASALDEASIPECDIIGLDMNMRVREEERRVSQQISGNRSTGRPVASVVSVDEMRLLNFGSAYDSFIRNIEYRHLSMQTLSFMFARYGKRECSYCGFLLHSLGSWKIHTGSHEGKTDLHCEECDYKCRHKFLLDRHILITHKKQDFGCDLCSKRFPYREYVYLHKRKDHYGGKMKCTFCVLPEFETEDEKVMKRHIIEEHPEMTSKQIAQIIGRKVHFTGRDGILFVKCKYCQKGFNRAAFLRQHVQLVHFKQKTFLCDQCGYKSNTSARLRTHMAVHTEKRDVVCDQCGAGFKNKVYLYKHIRRSHKRYATARGAAYCKRTRLKNMISLLQKERQEGSSYERQEIIQKEKAKLFGVDRSSVSVEGVRVEKSVGVKPSDQPPTQINVYQCGDCGEYFESIGTLKKHFTNVHGESPNIPLNFDAASGSGTSDSEQVNIALDALNNGSVSASVNQLFQCAKCNRMFPDMKSVEHHVKEVHATDTFLISDEGSIPSQELDLAAEVINHLTRESNQPGQVDVIHNDISQNALDALSVEAQDAASTLTSLPDAVLESSQMQAQIQPSVAYEVKGEDGGKSTSSSALNILSQEMSDNTPDTTNIEVVVSGRDDELEAAQLLQQMGIFQQFTTTSSETITSQGELQLASTTSVKEGEDLEGTGESVTIMVIEENPETMKPS